ncbi:hypothetical protein MsAg5_00500 [Methanosarcinaceae archaeon Ag5]|uniref:Uncharacterized protein n=1 Tax=Methanolapillus africanus TaxID=3028297 RepID=A0AAE4MIH7_9EURY|nr:hypothetical protein [Methanosarcinaceae archaeon Ag5]
MMNTIFKKAFPLILLLLPAVLLLSGCIDSDDNISAGNISNGAGSVLPNDSNHSAPGFESGNNSAAAYIQNQLAAQDHVYYVYKDFADGQNSFTQKAWMGNNNSGSAAMFEAAEPYSGTSSVRMNMKVVSGDWNGFMFLTGSTDRNGQPQLDFGEHDTGIDLTGASKLTFYARGENGGERVEFFMGGLGYDEYGRTDVPYPDSARKVSLGYVTLTDAWTKYEIDLTGKNLSRIGCGFGWVSNDRQNPGKSNITFYVDEIRYEFDDASTSASASLNPMFLQSYASEKPGTDASIINNFAYTYDNALVIMVLTNAGEYERAGQIADAMVYALDHDRFYSDGRLRNAYMAGNPESFPGWFSKGQPFAKMPGFYDLDKGVWYEDYYAVSTSTGNMAWAVLAMCDLYDATDNEKYLTAAEKMAGFILLQKDETNGGFMGGYEGFDGNQTRMTYKSTEHNIDLIPAFARLSDIEAQRGNAEKSKMYAAASGDAKKFVLSMYDADRGCFYTGTGLDGKTINRDVLPLDCNTWAILALGDDFSDSEKVMAFVEQNMAVENGYDFNADKDGAWFEGTSQMAVCYAMLGKDDDYRRVMNKLNANTLPDGSITAADRDGVSTGFKVSGLDLDWEYNKRVHLGATAWLSFAQTGYNPLKY